MLLCRRIIPLCDKERLVEALARAHESWLGYAPHLDIFRAELRRAKAVLSEQVPNDMITMNSRFAVFDRHRDQTIVYSLVYPGQETPQQGRLSVLSPIGTALFGARVGDEVCWLSSAGPETATIRRLLYQPEAAGHYHL